MFNTVSPMELYEAARETCLRLYVANGGDKRDLWNIQPYPGTAAISCQDDWNSRSTVKRKIWTLCMPALPLDVRVPRWQADLIAAYTVHELLHALWSNWDVVHASKIEGVGMLTNAIEDCRIERNASEGKLVLVSEARRLLQILNAHLWNKASSKGARLDDPNQFAYMLTLVIFGEKLGYLSSFPKHWRKLVAPRMLPLFDKALARFASLNSTQDAFELAKELRDMAKALPPPPPPQGGGKGKGKPEDDEGDEGEGDEGEGDEGDEDEGDEGDKGEGDEGEGVEGEESEGDEPESTAKGAGEPQDGNEGDALSDKPSPKMPAGTPQERDGEASEGGAPSNSAGLGDMGDEGDLESHDLSDNAQNYSEANLDDLSTSQGQREARDIEQVVNAGQPREEECLHRGNPTQAGARIASPAKLRRHLTMAVKAPERIGVERHQNTGRLDVRDVAGIARGADTVYRKRIEDEGREAAVTLLLDISSSMGGERIAAARAMALHMGDALKAAGVRFEVCTFYHRSGQVPNMHFPKPFRKQWNRDARAFVAGLDAMGGTTMLPAIKHCAQRLLDVASVSRRILVVLTDGCDTATPQANALQCKALTARGVEVLGIGLMLEGHERLAIVETFNHNAVLVNDCETLSSVGLRELVKQLDKGARA